MFGRKDATPGSTSQQETQSPSPARSVLLETRPPQPAASPVLSTHRPRELVPTPTPRRNPSESRAGGSGESRLIVGQGLSLSGEIAACDVLVVEGKVDAKLSDGKLLEITECGQFRGSVEIENADIAGRYDGQLTVRGRLTVRGTGRISGMVKYGELEVNAGGQIIGELQVVGAGSQASQPNFKNAAKFTALAAEEDSDEQQEQEQRVAANS